MNAELVERAAALYRERRHTKIVAEILGLRLDKTRRLLAKAGIRVRRGRVGPCHRRHDELCRMAAEGWTIDAMAVEMGTNQKTVSRYIQEHGFERPPNRQHPTDRGPFARNHKGPCSPRWRGGLVQTPHGYVLVWSPDHPNRNRHGYVLRHRLLMSEHLGRPLTRREVVHHKNGIPGDDRIENLQLFASNAEHLRHELTGVPCPARGRRGPRGPRRKSSPTS